LALSYLKFLVSNKNRTTKRIYQRKIFALIINLKLNRLFFGNIVMKVKIKEEGRGAR